jgi:NADH:ubiquinone oxidoreductase subunit H
VVEWFKALVLKTIVLKNTVGSNPTLSFIKFVLPTKLKMIALIICTVLKILAVVIPLLISVAYFTIAERKIMGIIQRRKGPNVIGFLGLLQPLADGLKLFVKETIFPSNSNIIIFLIAPMLTFVLSLIG